MSLTEPSKKMSKSDPNERATLFVLDEPDSIKKKISSAVTDSGSEIKAESENPNIKSFGDLLASPTKASKN